MRLLKKYWLPLLILFVCFLLYLPSIFNELTYFDDYTLLVKNKSFISSSGNLINSFTEDVFISNADMYYRPILTISFIVDTVLGNGSTWFYHLSNILLHTLCCISVFYLLVSLGYKKQSSFLATALFAIHPVLTPGVSWIPGRNDTLLALFSLLSIALFVKEVKNDQRYLFLLHSLLFILAMFTKETAVVIIPVCLVYYFLVVKKKSVTNLLPYFIVWFLAIAVWWLIRKVVLVYFSTNPSEYFLKAGVANLPSLLQYFGKVFFPFNLTPLPTIMDTNYLYGLVSLVIFLFVCIRYSDRKRFVVFGFFWFLIFLFPSLFTHNFSLKIGSDYMLEHRLYMPLVGVLISLMELSFFRALKVGLNGRFLAYSIVVVSFVFINLRYQLVFKDRVSFWLAATKGSPKFAFAHLHLAEAYAVNRDYTLSMTETKKVLELDPLILNVHNLIGYLYMAEDKYDEAESEFLQEINIHPNYLDAYMNMGILRNKQKRYDEAVSWWLKVVEVNPYQVRAYYYLAITSYRQGKNEEATMYLSKIKDLGYPVHEQFLKDIEKQF